MRTLLLLSVLALLVAPPLAAADSMPALTTTGAAVSAQLGSSDAPACPASRAMPTDGAPLPFDVSTAVPEDDARRGGDGPAPICPRGCPQFAACCPYNWCIC